MLLLNYDNFLSQCLAPAQILLRWAVQQGLAVIPKSNNHDRLLSNKDVLDWSLSEEDFKSLSALNINFRVRSSVSFMITVGPDSSWFLQLNNPVDLDPRLGIFA